MAKVAVVERFLSEKDANRIKRRALQNVNQHAEGVREREREGRELEIDSGVKEKLEMGEREGKRSCFLFARGFV